MTKSRFLAATATTVASILTSCAAADAADATWIAASSLESGLSPYCVGGQFTAPTFSGQTDWQVDIRGTRLTLASRSAHRSYTLDVQSIQPDGSGRAVGMDDRNRELVLTFEPGSGARAFHLSNSIDACRYAFAPRRKPAS